MPTSRPLVRSLLIAAFAAAPLALSHAQISGGTGGGSTGGGISGGITGGGTGGTSTGPGAGTGTSTGPAAIPGQSESSTAPLSSDTIGNARTPSPTTRGDTYDRLPDEPGPDHRLSPEDPLDNNPAAAVGPQPEFPAGNATGVQRDSEIVPGTERATRGDATRQSQAQARQEEIRRQKERTDVDTTGECMKAWDPETHISKDKWRETCERTLTEPHL